MWDRLNVINDELEMRASIIMLQLSLSVAVRYS